MFKKHIENFNENIKGLRDFVELIAPYLTKRIDEYNQYISPLITLGIANKVIAEQEVWEDGEKEKVEKIRDSANAEVLKVYKKEIDVVAEIKDLDLGPNSKTGQIGLSMRMAKEDGLSWRKNFENMHKTNAHISLLYKNSLISLISTVEWFFSEILHLYYDKHPEAAGIQKKTMTLSDLKAFTNIEEAEKYLVDVKIEEVLRGNFESWINLLKTELSMGLAYIEPVRQELIEIFQRRNLFVHNGGVVNSIYLSKVNQSFRENIKSGDQLEVSKEYLDNAISKLQKAFLLIALEMWKNVDKSDKSRGDVITDIVYENLLESRWDVCEGLTYFIINDSNVEIVDRVVAQLNYWLCKKRSGQFESVKKEVFNVDYSDKRELFQLALFSLRDDKKLFFDTLPLVLDTKQLDVEKLDEFPIFQEMRETEDYIKFKEESPYFNEKTKEIESL
jgi:uncharacterized protein YkuJ